MGWKNKNISRTIPTGRIVRTRDEYFAGQKHYRKPGYENKGLYRGAVVVDSNRNGDLALVKLTTSQKGKKVQQGDKSKYRPRVETLDDSYKSIRIGPKFKETKKRYPKHIISRIKRFLFSKSSSAKNNRRKVQKMKGRQKK